MENKEIAAILREAVDTYGIKNQAKILQEECSELIVAVSHYDRGREKAFDNLVEELADVQIMIWQMAYGLGAEAYLSDYINKKAQRLKERLANYKSTVDETENR